MSTGTAGPGTLPSSSPAGTSAQAAKRERYIERQLRRTRRQVRGVELASRLMLLAAAAVAFFLIAAVVDHWLVPGGLSIYGRLAFLAVFLVGAGWFAAREIAPLFVYRINPLFAAQTIERAKPTLKNSLLNFLLLRSNRSGVPEVVLSAVEEQAAASLERTSIEHVVDRTRLIQIGYLLLAMVAAFCTYYLLSPKSPLQTVGRVVLPWSDLQPPSRVEIHDIQPGTTTVFRGERVSISAVVKPLQEGEAVTLYFSTADRQSVDQPVRMYVTKDSYGRHTVTLPPAADAAALASSAGLQQDVEYRIEAGDAVSRTYRLSVVQAPNIVVDKLDYAYPDYTRLDAESVEKTGDIRAVEGTQVTIHALANQPITSAWLDLGGDGRHKHPMQVKSGPAGGHWATCSITLALNDERTAPLFSHYFVRFVSDRGHENREPIRYRVDVTPDPAPEVRLLKPDKVETAVPLNAPLTFELEASDALYGLADLRIVATVGGEPAFRRNRSVSRDDPSAARLVHKQPEQLDRITLAKGEKLKVGDVIEYWAEAADNKAPQPNVTKTEVRKLLIVEPKQQPNPNDQQQQENNQGDGKDNQDEQNQKNQDRNNQQPNERDGKNDPQNNDQKTSDQKDNGQKNEQAKNDDSKKDDRKNKGGEKGRGGQNQDQAKSDQSQSSDANGKGQNDDNKTERSQEPNNEEGGAGRDASNQQKSDQNKGAKGTAADQRTGEQTNNEREDSAAADTPRNEQPNQTGKGSPGDNRQRQDGQQKDESQPVDKSDDGGAFKRILDHAKQKDGKSPEQSNDAQDDQPAASGQRSSEQNKSNDANQKRANTKRESGEPESAKNNQNKRDSQPGPRDEGRGKNGDSEDERTGNEESNQKDTQKTTAGGQKDDGSKTGGPEPAQKDDSQKTAKSGAAKDDQRKPEDRGNEKTGGDRPSPEKDRRPMTDDPQAAQEGAKDDDDSNEKSPGAGSKANRDDADKGPKDEQRKGAAGAEKKSDDGKIANEKTDGSGAQNTNQSGNEKQKQDGSKSGTTASGQKSDKSQSNDPEGPSKDGSPDGKTNGKAAQPRNQKDGQGKSQKGGEPGDMPPADGNDNRDTPDGAPDGKGTATGGGGGPRDNSAPPPERQQVPPEDDKANLEYAKRATDLALDHLRNQLKDDRPDQELLDRLGWSKEDLQKLLSRWEKLEREAKQPGPSSTKAKDNLQEAIKSLGLRSAKTTRKASTNADDATRGLREAAHSAPPSEYAEQYRAFKKRTSRGEK